MGFFSWRVLLWETWKGGESALRQPTTEPMHSGTYTAPYTGSATDRCERMMDVAAAGHPEPPPARTRLLHNTAPAVAIALALDVLYYIPL